MRFRLVLVIAAVATFGLAASAQAQDKAAIDKGMKVYDTATPKCSACHQIAGKGSAKGPLDAVGTKLSADEIRAWITDPKGTAAKAKKPTTMPAYPKLTKDDVDALVAYLSSLKKK
ncbi:MAG TPA: cytochrome c [Vicinamibacterales bacterium]|nr:cytochrome c [Vicinamibacterales bacterium]